MCPRTLCTLAHVFEAAGLCTIVITPMREVAERMKTPRTLHTVFPLGLSLGKPRDREFQGDVLRAAFELLDEATGPVIRKYPVTISPTDHQPISCSLPPRVNTDVHPAVDEAQSLKKAYDRAHQKNGRTSVGMIISADKIPEALERFVKIVEGEHWEEVGFAPRSMYPMVQDIRSYYEELACELAEGPIEP